MQNFVSIKGRGTDTNPTNRFETLSVELDEEIDEDLSQEPRTLKTQFFLDRSHTILSANDSPDLGFKYSINPYRGCEHGCVYCYARPTHEYLGFSAGLDFESKIMVKKEAPLLLQKELSKPKWQPQLVVMSGNTDCYQPIEKKLGLTRQCLEVFAEFRNPVGLITKNHLITRDVDVLKKLAGSEAVSVRISITTLNPDLARILEPRTSMPAFRLDAIRQLAAAGIPVGVNVAPIIPAINDSEIPLILKEARAAGAQFAGYTLVRLPHSVKDLFSAWLTKYFPDRKGKVLHRLESLRGGKLYDSQFGKRMKGEGPWAEEMKNLFHISARKWGFHREEKPLNTRAFVRPLPKQPFLFDLTL